MKNLMIENVNLLDKMHEGLIVLSQADMSLRFANRPAVQLLKPDHKAGKKASNFDANGISGRMIAD